MHQINFWLPGITEPLNLFLIALSKFSLWNERQGTSSRPEHFVGLRFSDTTKSIPHKHFFINHSASYKHSHRGLSYMSIIAVLQNTSLMMEQ